MAVPGMMAPQFGKKRKKKNDESAEDPKEEATETKAQEAAEDVEELDEKKKRLKRGATAAPIVDKRSVKEKLAAANKRAGH